MDQDTFITRRRADWRRLEILLESANQSIGALSDHELRELGRLYRLATSDLALAQRDYPSEKVVLYLNHLVGRAHAVIYRGEPLSWRQFRSFYARSFPVLYRRLLPHTLAAFLLFLVPALVAFAVVYQEPDTIYTIAGPEIAYIVEDVESGKMWTEIAPSIRPLASSAILTNNIQVMFLAFAGGILAGLLTAFVMISNGLQLGAIFGLLQHHGMSHYLGEFVAAHGFIELSVIFLAGGCGLYLGDGLLRPGLISRRQQLVERGHISVRLILGCIPFLILAGLIEGFISPSLLPWPLKLTIGLASGLALHGYWLMTGRNGEPQRSVPSTLRSWSSPSTPGSD